MRRGVTLAALAMALPTCRGEHEATFGLGAATTVQQVDVRFRDGTLRTLTNVAADARIQVDR